jgi:hypothetical protein
VWFLKAIYANNTVAVTYLIKEVELARRRNHSEITVTNQLGETMAVAEHILICVSNE